MKRGQWEDHYTRRARNEKWLARSVFKLQEIDRRYRLIRRGDRLLDLGCYPGSWSQYSIARVGPGGDVVGVDLQEPDHFSAPNFRFIKANVFEVDIEWLRSEIGPRDAVLSDLAPKTSGIRLADASRSMELAQKALRIALVVLKQGGHCLCKVFENEDVKAFRDEFSRHFDQTRIVRPSAVRKASREVYLLGLGLVEA
ncbi:MAG: RlmE family RNA methyltransferase [Desulfobacteraceae bacterium]